MTQTKNCMDLTLKDIILVQGRPHLIRCIANLQPHVYLFLQDAFTATLGIAIMPPMEVVSLALLEYDACHVLFVSSDRIATLLNRDGDLIELPLPSNHVGDAIHQQALRSDVNLYAVVAKYQDLATIISLF